MAPPGRPCRHDRLLARLGTADPDEVRVVRAPGRVNLIGDHTDYQDGWCLPVAIDRDVLVAARPRRDDRVTVRSTELAGTASVAADGSTEPPSVAPDWARLVAGVVRVLAERGSPATPADVALCSTVPVGAGLSSSAACTVGLLQVLATGATQLSGRTLARAAQRAEQLASGVPCGVMDQMACVYGRAGHALLLDCRTLAVETLALPGSLALVVVHSGLPRTLAASAYADRRARTEAAAAAIGVATLRDTTTAQVAHDPIARHVVTENARVLAFAAALRQGDRRALGPLMLASHASLRDDFGVSTPELDHLVDLLVAHGAPGARLTGAGFGGCGVALAERDDAPRIAAATVARYRAATGHPAEGFVVRAADGVERLAGRHGPGSGD